MNRYTVFWGSLLAISGVVMHELLISLGQQVFLMAPEYLPPAQIVSYGVIAAGAVLLLIGLLGNWPRYHEISVEDASKYFGRITLFNGVAAAVFVAPMLIPPLMFPILLTEWPGIYIVIAYSFFIIFGVLGMLAWSIMYRFTPQFFSRSYIDRRSVLLQILLSEVGLYTVCTVLFLAGFVGATLVHQGLVGAAVGRRMEFSDIPAAVSIFIIIISVFLGAINILKGKQGPTGFG